MNQFSSILNVHPWRFFNWATIGLLILIMLTGVARSSQDLLGGEEPLSSENAFVASVQSIQSDTITIRFDIADDYYLYRDKLSFSVHQDRPETQNENIADTKLLSPVFAESLTIDDEYFGEQPVFRDSTLIAVPYTSLSNFDNVVLGVKFQGCADMGLCYPPTTTSLKVTLPMSSRTASSAVVPSATENRL